MGRLCSFPKGAHTASVSASQTPQDFHPAGNTAESLQPWVALSGVYPTTGTLQSTLLHGEQGFSIRHSQKVKFSAHREGPAAGCSY